MKLPEVNRGSPRPVARRQSSEAAARRTEERHFDIPILLYHHILAKGAPAEPVAISVRQFQQHLDVLVEGNFTALTVSRLVNAVERKEGLPKRPVVITFDDGFESFAELAVPELIVRQMSAMSYVLGGDLGGFNHWDEARGYPRRRLMDQTGIRHVLDTGMEVGVHGWHHRDLLQCTSPELQEEIMRSKAELEDKLGTKLDHYAYAYGRYSSSISRLVSSAGYRSAMAVDNGASPATRDRFAMRRISLHSGDTPARFRLKLSRLFLKYSALRERRRKT